MQTVRLVELFNPESYALSLVFNRAERTFKGTVTVQGEAQQDQEIRLHSKGLVINSVTFDGKKAAFHSDNNNELVITHPDLNTGSHIIVVKFDGEITDSMHGLYPCYYEHNGAKKELLATQFESHHAREVFPCIDEPSAKATFDVTLTTEPGVTVLGNMPIKQQRTENDQLVTSFETTPRMSSYLLAWVIGELHKRSTTTKEGVEVNLWATPAQHPDSLDFGLDIAKRTIEFFDDYFGVPYPLPKSDHVALPDFSSGAMENWGLITYREVALLSDPKTSSLSNKRQVATVVAHELSHQWFGNLVTMRWWNDLWLNESFANIMEYTAVDALQQDWQIWLEHASYEIVSALRRDSIDGVQAIQTDVNHPDEIRTLFDGSIVYAKGGRLIRMLQTYIGDKAFQQGLQAYFRKYAYQNTRADDLWQCLSEASGQDITAMMNTWISQAGFPVVHVTQSDAEITLEQERFFIGPHDPSDSLWPIPLESSCSQIPPLLTEKSVTITHSHTKPLQLNQGSTAHFITHYDHGLMTKLLQSLDQLPEIDRLGLLHEQTLLAQAGIISSVELLPLLHHYRNETEEAVWDIMAIAINELKRFVEGNDQAEKKLRRYVGKLAQQQFERLGWDRKPDESEMQTKLRSIIIGLMLYSERPDIIQHALQLYKNHDLTDLDPELRTSIMSTVVRQAGDDQSIIDELLNRHQTVASSELKDDIASALTSTKNPEVVQRLIGLFKDKSVIRPQDFMRWFVWLLRNRYGRQAVWKWVRDQWQWVEQTFKSDMSYDYFPRYIASSLLTKEQLKEYQAFFTPLKSDLALKRNIDIGIKELSGRVHLIDRDRDAVQKALLDLDV